MADGKATTFTLNTTNIQQFVDNNALSHLYVKADGSDTLILKSSSGADLSIYDISSSAHTNGLVPTDSNGHNTVTTAYTITPTPANTPALAANGEYALMNHYTTPANAGAGIVAQDYTDYTVYSVTNGISTQIAALHWQHAG